jgi:hypothetical protein
MKTLLLITALVLASCGKKEETAYNTPVPAPIPNASIFNKYVVVEPGTGLHGLDELDFSESQLNVQEEVEFCDGSYGNSGNVNGVALGHSLFEGTESEGTFQFGHLAYVGASNPLCRDLSKERYTYKTTGKNLKFCMVNYPFCANYKLAE